MDTRLCDTAEPLGHDDSVARPVLLGALAPGSPAPTTLLVDGGLLGRLATYPLLDAAEEVELAKAAEAGALAAERLTRSGLDTDERALLEVLVAGGEAAFTRMVVGNLRLVGFFARRRLGAGEQPLSYGDLVAEGVRGLVRAVHKWDYTRGLKFSTYAGTWIISVQDRAVRLARGLSEDTYAQVGWIRRVRAELTQELQRTPTEPEVSARAGLSVSRIAALEALARPALELDRETFTEDATTLGDLVADAAAADPAEALVRAEQHRQLRSALAHLPDRYRRVVVDHFGLDNGTAATVEELAARYRLPTPRVQATLQRALEALRTAALADR